MAHVYGEELKKAILARKARAQAAIDDRADRIGRWETDEDDCFMSQRIDERSIRECNMQLEILDTDGTMEIGAIIDADGNEVRVHHFTNKWGRDSVVGRGVFASSVNALLKKTGWTRKTIRVPVWTKFCSPTGGMMGVYCGDYEKVRWHTNMVTGEYVGYPD